MTLLAVSEAAERIGVSTRQVQHLVADGELVQVVRGFVDETSVARLVAVRGGSHVRAWSEATAWGAIAILSGLTPTWMGESQRSRLKSRLRGLEVKDLIDRARGRARVVRFSGHASSISRLRAEVINTSGFSSTLGLADANSGVVDGYVAADELAIMGARHGLIRDAAGAVNLRATAFDLAVVSELAAAAAVLAALDLAESLDTRERRAGLDALALVLKRLR